MVGDQSSWIDIEAGGLHLPTAPPSGSLQYIDITSGYHRWSLWDEWPGANAVIAHGTGRPAGETCSARGDASGRASTTIRLSGQLSLTGPRDSSSDGALTSVLGGLVSARNGGGRGELQLAGREGAEGQGQRGSWARSSEAKKGTGSENEVSIRGSSSPSPCTSMFFDFTPLGRVQAERGPRAGHEVRRGP